MKFFEKVVVSNVLGLSFMVGIWKFNVLSSLSLVFLLDCKIIIDKNFIIGILILIYY